MRSMGHDELIAKMRGRIAMCRRLAETTTDARTAETLRQMADEGERDVARLAAEKTEIILKPESPLA
jgi:hypothetical protein